MKLCKIVFGILVPAALVPAVAHGVPPSARSDLAALVGRTVVGTAAAQEPQSQEAMLRCLREKSQANKALLASGQVRATFRRTLYDVTGHKPGREEVMQIHAQFKGDKVRVDWEGLRGRIMRQWRTVLTNEEYLEWMVRNSTADVVDPNIGRGKIAAQLTVLPWRNLASSNWCVTADDTLLSREITRSGLAGREVYVVKVVTKDSPKDTWYYYMDPARGAAVVRSESRYDFGRGPVLVSESDVELQDAQNGAWCLKRHKSTIYREDRTVRAREEIEVDGFDFKSEVPDRVFTWEGMGLPAGTQIRDRRSAGAHTSRQNPPLGVGAYGFPARLTANDPNQPEIVVPITAEVTGSGSL